MLVLLWCMDIVRVSFIFTKRKKSVKMNKYLTWTEAEGMLFVCLGVWKGLKKKSQCDTRENST